MGYGYPRRVQQALDRLDQATAALEQALARVMVAEQAWQLARLRADWAENNCLPSSAEVDKAYRLESRAESRLQAAQDRAVERWQGVELALARLSLAQAGL